VQWDLDKLNTAGFLTEWGALVDADALDTNDANIVGLLADNLVQSWTYWQFKSFKDPTTQAMQRDGTVAEGLYDPWTGVILDSKVALLTRTYPKSVAGAIRSLFFDPVSKHFKLVFTASTSAKGRTHIYASSRWHYPQGVAATVEPEDMATVTIEGNIVYVELTPDCKDGQVLTVRIESPNSGFKYFIYFMFVFTFLHFFLYICTFVFIAAAVFYVAHSCVKEPEDDEKEKEEEKEIYAHSHT
jgi:hypothetical protein